MKIHRLIPWAACIVLLIFTVGNCRGRKQAENKADNVRDYLTDSIHYYKLKNGKQAAKISALNGDNASLELLLSETSSQLKEITRKYNRVDAAIEIKTVTKIDTAHQRYTDTIKYEFKRDWTIQSEWYKIQGTSTQLGNTINSIKIPNDLSIAVGQEGSKYTRSEEHRSELQSRGHIVCRLLLEKKHKQRRYNRHKYRNRLLQLA